MFGTTFCQRLRDNGSSNKSLKDIWPSFKVSKQDKIQSVTLSTGYVSPCFGLKTIRNGKLVSDDATEFEVFKIHGFQRIQEESQTIATYYTKDGKFKAPIETESIPCEYLVDAMVDHDVDDECVAKGIIPKKYLHRLKMPQDYPDSMKFHIGDHINAKIEVDGDFSVVEAEVIDIDPIYAACQLSGEYLLTMTVDGVRSQQWFHEIHLRDLDDGEEDWDIGLLAKVWYNVNRAKQQKVYYYSRYGNNLIDEDQLPYDLDVKSVFYGKKEDIDLNYKMQRGEKKVLNQNVVLLYEKGIELEMTVVDRKRTVFKRGSKQVILREGVKFKAPQVWKFVLPFFDEIKSKPIYSERSITWDANAAKFCEKIDKTGEVVLESGGSLQIGENIRFVWSRRYEMLFVRKFEYSVHNPHA